jgi:hypothetical protein
MSVIVVIKYNLTWASISAAVWTAEIKGMVSHSHQTFDEVGCVLFDSYTRRRCMARLFKFK